MYFEVLHHCKILVLGLLIFFTKILASNFISEFNMSRAFYFITGFRTSAHSQPTYNRNKTVVSSCYFLQSEYKYVLCQLPLSLYIIHCGGWDRLDKDRCCHAMHYFFFNTNFNTHYRYIDSHARD
jgi:hypothetical protein